MCTSAMRVHPGSGERTRTRMDYGGSIPEGAALDGMTLVQGVLRGIQHEYSRERCVRLDSR